MTPSSAGVLMVAPGGRVVGEPGATSTGHDEVGTLFSMVLAPKPFRIEPIPQVDYVYVVPSHCGGDFTVDKYVQLVYSGNVEVKEPMSSLSSFLKSLSTLPGALPTPSLSVKGLTLFGLIQPMR